MVNGISVNAGSEGSVIGEEVEITITFTSPIVLPSGHYFFRPEVLLTNGDFLYLSGPRPIVPPGTPFVCDGSAGLDSEFESGSGLAANRHRHYRWRPHRPRSTWRFP